MVIICPFYDHKMTISGYLTYKEWKHQITTNVHRTRKFDGPNNRTDKHAIIHAIADTLPIRNGNQTLLKDSTLNSLANSIADTLPIRNGNSVSKKRVLLGVLIPNSLRIPYL